ncbi:CmNV_012-like protein [Aratus pisonii nudivirus]|nr:CmNV_012-like protein [Aratus pisonii nudivirus]
MIIFNLKNKERYIGGLPPKIRVQLDPELVNEIDHNILELVRLNPTTVYVSENSNNPQTSINKIFPSHIHDIIITFSKDEVNIIKPNFINSKQTNKNIGIIVCENFTSYNYNFLTTKWEYQSSEK